MQFFDAVVYSSAAGSAKPDRRIFQHALDQLLVAPAEALHVGDSRTADYEGALAAGLTAVLLRRDECPTDDHCIATLDEIRTWLTPS